MNTDQDNLSAWREGLTEAAWKPAARQQLLRRENELLPRFAAHYDKLRVMPRRMRRALQRQWKKSLAGIAMLLALGQTPTLAATINVGGNCTLSRAITSANNDTVVGGCTRGSGADRIVLPRNSTQTLTAVNNTNYGPTGLPTIRSNITLDGNGSTVRRAPRSPNFRILAVSESGNLTLQETTVTGGVANTVPGTDLSGDGGGLANYSGELTLISSTVTGNRADKVGGGISNYAIRYTADAILTLTNSVVSGNRASLGGGVINSGGAPGYTGVLRMTNSAISGNTAGTGGGVFSDNYSVATVNSSTISGNTALFSGGGVEIRYGGYVTLTNSTVSGNTASSSGGGLARSRGVVYLINSTVSRNTASGDGGGVYSDGAGAVYLSRTLISGNTAFAGQEVFRDTGGLAAADFNVFGHRELTNAQALVNFTPGTTDITATSDGDRPTALSAILNTNLANNGGPTRTHLLPAGSPAVDSVDNGTCPPPGRDQRGVARPQDGDGDGGAACDTGSFERR